MSQEAEAAEVATGELVEAIDSAMRASRSIRVASRHPRNGQALLELTVALVAIMVIVAGLIQIGRLGMAHLDTIHEARSLAAQYSMSDVYQTMLPPAQWIQEWHEGPDGRRFSRDDVPTIGSSHALRQFVLPVAHPAELRQQVPTNRVSRLQYAQEPIEEFDFVRATARSRPVPLLPVARHLIYRADSIRIESEAVLTWTKNIE
jgi:hypothetical protein